MRRRIMAQLLLFLLLFGTWYEISYVSIKTTSGRITGPIPVFPKIQIELLKSHDKTAAKDALNKTVKPLLVYIVPELADETWDAEYLFIDLVPGNEEEVVISLSLKPDRGILVIMQKQNSQYILLYLLDNLLPVTKLDMLLTNNKDGFLVTREDHEERLGAYSEIRTVKIWNWHNDSLFMVWSDNSYWEVNWLNTWQDPDAKPKKWFKLIQDIGITFRSDPVPTIFFVGQQTLLEAPTEIEVLPPEYNFTLMDSRRIETAFHWDENWHRFIFKTGVLKNPGVPPQEIAVLMDMENHLEGMVDKEKKMFQILDKDGKNFIVDKKYVQLDP